MSSVPDSGKTRRVYGVDGLRLYLAAAVAVYHVPFFFPAALPPVSGITSGLMAKLLDTRGFFVNGQAAVVMFFVVSGFSIHYAYGGRVTPLGGFYAERGLRIGLPALAAVALTWLVGFKPLGSADGIPVWSLYCELAYYALYPLLLSWMRRGWKRALTALGLAASALVIAFSPPVFFFQDYGFLRTTVIGLPMWLLGAWLAEDLRAGKIPVQPLPVLWIYRLAALALGWVAALGAWTKIAGMPFTLTLFALFCFPWLRCEIGARLAAAEEPLTDRWGRASYSIYLVHPLALFFAGKLSLDSLSPVVIWSGCLCLVGLASALFYFLGEIPSHRLAKSVGKSLAASGATA